MSTNDNPRGDIEQQVLQRAASDPQFRQQLLSDPRAAVEQAFGIRLPDEVKVQVLEETANHVYLVLPAQHHGGGGEDDRAGLPRRTYSIRCGQ